MSGAQPLVGDAAKFAVNWAEAVMNQLNRMIKPLARKAILAIIGFAFVFMNELAGYTNSSCITPKAGKNCEDVENSNCYYRKGRNQERNPRYSRRMCSTIGAVLPQGASSMTGKFFRVKRQERLMKLNSAGALGLVSEMFKRL